MQVKNCEEELGAELVRKPYSSNMTINDNGGFETLPEFRSFCVIKMNDGISRSCSLYPSEVKIYIEDDTR